MVTVIMERERITADMNDVNFAIRGRAGEEKHENSFSL
jgi:hypothetical protein